MVTDILSRNILKLLGTVVYMLNTLHYRAPFRGLGSTHTIHLRLIGKHIVDFVVVLIKLFSLAVYGWGATSEYQVGAVARSFCDS